MKIFSDYHCRGEDDIPPKPDSEPFHRCLEKLKIAAGQAVSWEMTIVSIFAAHTMPVCTPYTLKHDSVRRNWPQVQTSVPVIASLKQLLELDYLC